MRMMSCLKEEAEVQLHRPELHLFDFPPSSTLIIVKPHSHSSHPHRSTATTTTTTTTASTTTSSSPPRKRIEFAIEEKDLEENFSVGSGRGGQAMQKTANKVVLHHIPTGIVVQCHKTRSLETNRSVARKILKDKIDELLNGSLSKNAQKIEKIRRRKQKAKYRQSKKKEERDNSSELDS
eukprot:TRINITY_DN4684_c0_g1_i2.p1 TRINITY_DN4684_c0_g1~~TRINITY_DN4684_c0_g1_i2.p1  ORF type:complete len:180 (+),score=60.44 TRINITY_DN4684_c0_g1_i2:274-813(+)